MNEYGWDKLIMWAGFLSLVYVAWKLVGGFSFGLEGLLTLALATAPVWLLIIFICNN